MNNNIINTSEKEFGDKNSKNNQINNESQNIKKLVDELLIDKDNENNKKIKLFLIENRDNFKSKFKKESSDLNNDFLKIDFKDFEDIEKYNINDPLFRIILINIIKKTYQITNSKNHEIIFFEKEKVFCLFEYKYEIKRYHQYSPESMQSLLDKFIGKMDFYEIISENLDKEIDFENYTIEDLKYFYSGGYKNIILYIIKKEIYKKLPNFVFDELNNEVYLGMVQYFYRTNFENINDFMMKEFNLLLNQNIDNIIQKNPELKMRIKNTLATKSSIDILEGTEINKKSAEYIFEKGIKPLIDYIYNDKIEKKKKIVDNEKYKKELNKQDIIRNIIMELGVEKGIEILEKHSEERLGIQIDKALERTIIYNNLLKYGVNTISYELSKLIFKYLFESYKSNENSKIIEGFKYFLNNFGGTKLKNGKHRPHAKFSVEYFRDISKGELYGESFLMKFDIIISSIKKRNFKYDISNSKDIKENITETLENIIPIMVEPNDKKASIGEGEFLLYHIIKEFSYFLFKKSK